MNQVIPVTLSQAAEDNFKKQLARLDELIQLDSITPMDGISLTECRGCVAAVMKDLAAHPELDSIVIDNDIRNIIIYVRKTSGVFAVQREEKAVKRETRTTSAKAKSAGADVVANAFASMGINLFGTPATPAAPAKGKRAPATQADKDEFAAMFGGIGKPTPTEPVKDGPPAMTESVEGGPAQVQPSSSAVESDPLANFRNFLAGKK